MKTYSRLFLSLAVMGVSSVAIAAEETTTFDVTATVTDSCTVSATTLAFGAEVDAQVNTDGTSTLTVTCNSGAAYTIALDGGTALDTTARLMDDGATEDLGYQLYSDLGRSTVWDDATGTVAGTGDGTAIDHTVYGQIPAQPTAVAAAYSDTINVTVTY